jgi:hypothetical protein
MNVNIYIQEEYDDFHSFRLRKNKAKTKTISESHPLPKEWEEESGLEIISNPDTIRAKPESFGSTKAASNMN